MTESMTQVGIELVVTGKESTISALKQTASEAIRLSKVAKDLKASNELSNYFMKIEKDLTRVNNAMQTYRGVSQHATKANNVFGMKVQQVGYQVGDFFVQVQSGTDALVAFGQQGTQLAGLLPPLAGAIVGIGLSLGTMFLNTALKAKGLRIDFQAVGKDLADALTPIKPLLDLLSSAFNVLGNAAKSFGQLLLDNLDRIIVYTLTFATILATKVVAGFVMSGAAATALFTAVRVGIASTGIGLLVIGIGEAVLAILRFTQKVGGLGNALSLMKDVAVESFNAVIGAFQLVGLTVQSVSTSMAQWFVEKIAYMGASFVEFTWAVAEGLNGLFDTNLMGADASIFNSLRIAALDLEDSVGGVNKEISILKGNLDQPMKSVLALKEAMAAADETGKSIDVSNWLTGDSKKGGSGSGANAKDTLTQLQERVQSIADTIKTSMSDAFMSVVDGTQTVASAFKTMALSIIKQLYDVLVVQRIVGSFDAKTGAGTGLTGALMGMFSGGGGGLFGGASWSANGDVVGRSGIQAFANGGVVGSPTMFKHGGGLGVMGEAGPEAIMPLKRGSNGQLGVQVNGGSGGTTVNNNITVTGSDAAAVRMEVAKMIPQITNATKAAIIDAKKRGGQMGAAFQ